MARQRRRPRLNLVTLTGIALVALTFLASLAWFSQADREVTVYLARDDIPARRLVTDAMVTARRISPDAVAPGAIEDPDQIIGRYTSDAIFAGEAFTPQRLGTDITRTAEALTEGLTADMRVVSVPADVSGALAGRIKAGDTVDIIAVTGGDSGTGRVAATLVQQALVVDTAPGEAALASSARDNPGDSPVADTATGYLPGIYSLALSPAQAQLVALGASNGELYLSLVPVGSPEPFEPEVTTLDSLTAAGDLAPGSPTTNTTPGDDPDEAAEPAGPGDPVDEED